MEIDAENEQNAGGRGQEALCSFERKKIEMEGRVKSCRGDC